MSYSIRSIDGRTVQQSIGQFVSTWVLFGVGSTLGLAAVVLVVEMSGVHPGIGVSWIPYVGLFYFLGAWLPALLLFPTHKFWRRIPGEGYYKYALTSILAFLVLIPLLSIGLYIGAMLTSLPSSIWQFDAIELFMMPLSVWLPALLFPKAVEWMA